MAINRFCRFKKSTDPFLKPRGACGGKGGYVCKEKVTKDVVYNHPCQLTETRMKIAEIPGHKYRVLSSFQGSKKFNLINVMKCRGQCGESSTVSPVACVPTKLHFNKIKMEIKTIYQNGTQKVSRLV